MTANNIAHLIPVAFNAVVFAALAYAVLHLRMRLHALTLAHAELQQKTQIRLYALEQKLDQLMPPLN
jgi:two-component sensor histidine kinase